MLKTMATKGLTPEDHGVKGKSHVWSEGDTGSNHELCLTPGPLHMLLPTPGVFLPSHSPFRLPSCRQTLPWLTSFNLLLSFM